jgi:hypothetical protein
VRTRLHFLWVRWLNLAWKLDTAGILSRRHKKALHQAVEDFLRDHDGSDQAGDRA